MCGYVKSWYGSLWVIPWFWGLSLIMQTKSIWASNLIDKHMCQGARNYLLFQFHWLWKMKCLVLPHCNCKAAYTGLSVLLLVGASTIPVPLIVQWRAVRSMNQISGSVCLEPVQGLFLLSIDDACILSCFPSLCCQHQPVWRPLKAAWKRLYDFL